MKTILESLHENIVNECGGWNYYGGCGGGWNYYGGCGGGYYTSDGPSPYSYRRSENYVDVKGYHIPGRKKTKVEKIPDDVLDKFEELKAESDELIGDILSRVGKIGRLESKLSDKYERYIKPVSKRKKLDSLLRYDWPFSKREEALYELLMLVMSMVKDECEESSTNAELAELIDKIVKKLKK